MNSKDIMAEINAVALVYRRGDITKAAAIELIQPKVDELNKRSRAIHKKYPKAPLKLFDASSLLSALAR